MAERGDEVAEVARWAEGIDQVHQCIGGRFRRPEPRRRALDYLRGLLSSESGFYSKGSMFYISHARA